MMIEVKALTFDRELLLPSVTFHPSLNSFSLSTFEK